MQLELLLDVLAVRFNRLDTEVQVLGDLAGFSPLANELKDFKRKIKGALRKVLAIYRDLQVEDVPGGLRLAPSRVLIAPR